MRPRRVYFSYMENTKSNAVRVIIFCIFVGLIIMVMSMVVGGTGTSTKFNQFAQCISQKKLKFYGAFWCPHCQAQKAAFGDGAQYLPYIECSNPDKSQTQACVDAKIESYPTWVYPTEISFSTDKSPIICDVQPGPDSQPSVCAQDGSRNFKTWVFGGLKIQSDKEAIHLGNNWTFAAGSRSVGELDTTEGLQNLSNFSGCSLPADNTTK